MPTVQQLIERLESNYKPNDVLAYVFWSVDDIEMRAKDLMLEITKNQAEVILEKISRNHDASEGINWEVIDHYLNTLPENTDESFDPEILREKHNYHGGAFDRGGADFYYWRPKEPHYWPSGTGVGIKVTEDKMTKEEIAAYHLGYDEAEEDGDRKQW